ncbi:MAG: amidohydrolase family protein [Pseudomonadota bacterium]|nr:amidohydrolase family protein [Pseudomonadota bacterium]
MKYDLVIKNAQLVDENVNIFGSIGIQDSKIVAIADSKDSLEASRVIDAQGRTIIPGVFDPHCHLGVNYDYDEDMRTEMAAAARGGITTAFLYIRNKEASYIPFYKDRRARGEANSIIDFGLHFGIQREEHIHEIPIIAKETGVQSFKLYFGYEPDNPIGIIPANDGWVYATMREVAKLPRGVVSVHCENTSIARWVKQELLETGRTDLAAYSESRPVLCEIETIKRMIFLASKTGARLQVVHTTAGQGADLAKAARAEGIDVQIETCPHYLVRTAYDKDIGIEAKISPPLRDNEQKEWLWRGMKNGRIFSLGSDHVPFFPKKSESVWTEKPGVVSFPWELALMLHHGVHKRGLPLQRLVQLNSANPARRFGIYPNKGSLNVGTDADIVLVDLDLEQEVVHEGKGTCIYSGMKLRGWPVLTISRGEVVFENNQVNESLYGRGRCLIYPGMDK